MGPDPTPAPVPLTGDYDRAKSIEENRDRLVEVLNVLAEGGDGSSLGLTVPQWRSVEAVAERIKKAEAALVAERERADRIEAGSRATVENLIGVMGACDVHPCQMSLEDWLAQGGGGCPVCLTIERDRERGRADRLEGATLYADHKPLCRAASRSLMPGDDRPCNCGFREAWLALRGGPEREGEQ